MKNLRNSLLIIFALLAFGTTAWAQQSGEHELLFTDYYGSYYRFYYTSTDAAGEPVTLSSLLAFQKPNEMTSNDVNNSVLINSHYTITADAQCPSNIQEDYDMDYPDHILLTLLFSGNSSNYNDLVSKSVVIMPDYEGYGVSVDRTHLYLAEELTAKQVVDGAVSGLQLYQQLVTAGNAPRLANDWRSFSMGFSQGGAVALAVQRYIEQHGLSSDLRFRGTLCGDGPYDLIATLRYYMEDNGTSYDVTTDHRAEQATLPVVLPMILKGMIDSEPVMANYQLSDYLTDDFLATGILDWLNSKTMTNKQIATAWLNQLQNGSTTANGITYSAPATMSQMFSKHGDAPWADLSKVFTPGFYSYLTDLSNFNSVPTNPGNAYQAMHLALANNGLCTGWRPSHRIQFMHSKRDMVVPYGNYLAFRDAHPEDEDVIYRVDNTFSTNDHQEAGTTFLSSLSNMGEKLHWIDESSLEWIGSGTEDDPYQIWNSDEWQLLCTRVNGEVSYYTGKYFKLMADITIEETFSSRPTKQVGHGENVNFRGIFDGNGHTMTINYVDNNDEDYCAPFRYIRNATIKNLHVAGSITKTDNRNAGGLVGTAFGTCHIINCRSSVDIFFDDPGDCSSGGFIGELGTSSSTDDTYFENCLFDGKLRGTSAYSWGGFIGWVEDEPDAYFTNCLFNPAQVNIGTDGSKTFARGDDLHFTNNYYKTLINDAQGSTNASDMDNETLRAALGNGWEIVTEDGVDKVVPIMGPRTLNGEGTPASPYLIANNGDWHALATNVQFGETYNGKYFQMTADISVGRMVGTSEANSFQGIFDGNAHTIAFNTTASENYCAPFRYANGATFQNLKVMGTINTGSQFAAGFVGYVTGNGCTFTNCESNITINASIEGDGTHGGFVANIAAGSNVFTGCAFTGSLLGASTHSSGGFVGWTDGRFSDGSAAFTDCLYNPAQNTMGTNSGATFARGWDVYIDTGYTNPDNITLNNCYYTETFGLTQGKQAHSIVAGEHAEFTLAFAADATEYNVSGITTYGTGIQYGDVFYAGNGDNVSLDLIITLSYHVVLNATYTPEGGTATAITPDENGVYTFAMPDADVTINAIVTIMDWEGSGTEDDPYLIYYPVQLDLLSTRVNNGNDYSGTFFMVMNDLEYDVNVEDNFTPIGDMSSHKFNGHFDGQGYTISGINTGLFNNYNGLFGYLDSGAEVKGIVLDNSSINYGTRTGGIAGANEGTVTNCHVTTTVTFNGNAFFVGGIVGENKGSVSQCTSAGTFTSSGITGGIAAYNYNTGTLSDNFVVGATILTAGDGDGTVVGYNQGTLQRNYYNNCTVADVENATGVGCGNADITDNDGAVPGNKIILAEHVTSDATVFTIPAYGETEEETFSVAAFGATVTLGYELSGYEVTYYVDETPIEGSTFTMPNEYVEAVVVDAMVSVPTQTIVLATGTNWVSINVEVTLDELKAALVAALPETAITIKGKAGSIKYVVRTHKWNGTLVWDITNMYKIEVPNACELTLGGMPVNPAEHPITITPNTANWIAYPLSNSMTLSEAFAGFEAVTGDVIQSKGGSARYNGGTWRSNGLTTLDPGQGYIYKSAATGDRTLVFPSSK